MPGLREQAAVHPFLVLGDLAGQRRPRADEAHVADEHVPQLRQLVERVLAQERARHRSREGRPSA